MIPISQFFQNKELQEAYNRKIDVSTLSEDGLLEQRDHPAAMGGIQRVYLFPNGYGASVIRTPFSYGGDDGKWELAVVRFTDTNPDDYRWEIDYDHPELNGDVRGHLTEDEVNTILKNIKDGPTTTAKAEDADHGTFVVEI